MAKASATEGHHTEVQPDGVHLCSPGPCPLLRVMYDSVFKRNKSLRDQMDFIDSIRHKEPDRAAKLSAGLQGRLEAEQSRMQMMRDLPPHATPEQRKQINNVIADAADLGIALTPEQFREMSRHFAATKSMAELEQALVAMRHSLDQARGVMREQLETGQHDRLTQPQGRDPTDVIRAQPGQPHGGKDLPPVTGDWFQPKRGGTGLDYGILPIPGQIANRLRNMTFANFADFRETFWKMVAQEPNLAREFNYHPGNAERMRNGQPPIVPGQALAGVKEWQPGAANIVYQIDHKQALKNAGGLYDLDNLQIVTKRVHDRVGE
jgi:hypothetical protein